MTLTVPPKASAPKIEDPDPCRISIRSTASSGTGMSPLWWPDCASFRRTPSTSTSIWPKLAPRTAKSVCTPRSPRARTSTAAVNRSTSAMLWTGSRAICSRVMTVSVRVTVSSSTGLAAAVTTTFWRKGSWARAGGAANTRAAATTAISVRKWKILVNPSGRRRRVAVLFEHQPNVAMREHRVRVLLERGLVAFGVRRALVGRRYQLARLGDDRLGLAGDVGHIIVECLVDSHDQLRERPEPGELGVVEYGLEQRMTSGAS